MEYAKTLDLKNFTDEQWRMHRWAYSKLTEKVDGQIAKILDAINESGDEENTVVIFTSDHGDMGSAHKMEHKTALYDEGENSEQLYDLKLDPYEMKNFANSADHQKVLREFRDKYKNMIS